MRAPTIYGILPRLSWILGSRTGIGSPRTLYMGNDADRLRRSQLYGLSQDEEERGGVVNRGARDERSSAIRRLQAIMT